MPQSGEAYESCEVLPFSNFIELSISGDTKWLIKSGTPTGLDELAEKIQEEYTEISGDKSNNELLEIETDIAYYKGRLLIAKSTIETLRKHVVAGLIDVLRDDEPNGLAIPILFDNLPADLDRAETYMQGDQMRINQLLSLKADIVGDEETGKKATKKDWLSRLSAIDKYRQTAPTNPANITVLQFIIMDTDFSDYIAMLKAENDKRSH